MGRQKPSSALLGGSSGALPGGLSRADIAALAWAGAAAVAGLARLPAAQAATYSFSDEEFFSGSSLAVMRTCDRSRRRGLTRRLADRLWTEG